MFNFLNIQAYFSKESKKKFTSGGVKDISRKTAILIFLLDSAGTSSRHPYCVNLTSINLEKCSLLLKNKLLLLLEGTGLFNLLGL
jgi:hypothetical protein